MVILIAVLLLLHSQFCYGEIQRYSKANTTFARVVSDLLTCEYCSYALAQRFTPTAFKISSLPIDLKQRLRSFYENRKHLLRPEPPIEFIWRDDMERSNGSQSVANYVPMMLDAQLKLDLENAIRLQLEEWTGLSRLVHTATWGIREYPRGAVLKPHVDQVLTHVLSAVINVHQEVDEPWPLVAFDHDKQRHEIFLNDTMDVLLYESATMPHGRPYPLKGESFVNLFLHFAPIGWYQATWDLLDFCSVETNRLCFAESDTCTLPQFNHYITDRGLVMDACDRNHKRFLKRHLPL